MSWHDMIRSYQTMIYTQRMTSIMMTMMINIGRRCNNDRLMGVMLMFLAQKFNMDPKKTADATTHSHRYILIHLSIVQEAVYLDHGEPRIAIKSQ
jgi:hypothetical protein